MILRVFGDAAAMSTAAAHAAAATVRRAIARSGAARLVAATAASQLQFLAALVREPGVAWPKVELFHLDEYIGIPASHPASFRRMLEEHLIVPAGIGTSHLLDTETDPAGTCRHVGRLLAETAVDLACVGIGENAHLAFNDPPADFVTEQPYLIVTLDDACRTQQVHEGWFARLDEVPRTAVSMSIRQILKSREILAVVPGAHKAAAVKATLEGDMTPAVPASILRTHPNVTLFLDAAAASLLEPATRRRFLPNGAP